MRRLSLVFLPFLAAFALVFGLFYLYRAFRIAQDGQVVPAALMGVFGLTGVGLATAIWLARKRVGSARSAGAPNAPDDGPRT